MHGTGYGNGYVPPPQRPSEGGQIALRILFVTLAVLSVGFLAWTVLLRLAVTTRSRTDWIVFGAVTALQTATLVLLGTDPGVDEFTTWRGDVGMAIMMLTLAGVVAYYLVADIRHGRARRLAFLSAGYASLYQRPPLTGQPAYGYPQAAHSPHYAPTPPPPAHPVHAQPTRTAGHAPVPAPAPAPQAHRIDQVRAELDELSDYLRKQEGGR